MGFGKMVVRYTAVIPAKAGTHDKHRRGVICEVKVMPVRQPVPLEMQPVLPSAVGPGLRRDDGIGGDGPTLCNLQARL